MILSAALILLVLQQYILQYSTVYTIRDALWIT